MSPLPSPLLSELELSLLQSPYVTLNSSPKDFLYFNHKQDADSNPQIPSHLPSPPPYLFTVNYSDESFENAYKSVVENMRKYLENATEDNHSLKQLELLKVAVASLLIYVQHNHTGPRVHKLLQHPFVFESNEEIDEHFELYGQDKKHFDSERWQKQRFSTHWEMGNRSEKEEKWFRFDDSLCPVVEFEEDTDGKNKYAIKKLCSDGEMAYALALTPHYLLCAKTILFAPGLSTEYLIDSAVLPSADWWRARVLFFQQQLLPHTAGSIYDKLLSLFSTLENQYGRESKYSEEHRDLVVKFYLEYGNMYHSFMRANQGKKYFQVAKDISDLWTNMTGVLGKRTKFQQEKRSLLVLQARSRSTSAPAHDTNKLNGSHDTTRPVVASAHIDTSTSDEVSESQSEAPSEAPSEAETSMPRHVALDEDSPMLEQIVTDNDKEPNLLPIDQVILLALCLDVKNRNPDHGLTTDEMFPFVHRVEMHPNNWMIHTMSLLVKTRLEAQITKFAQRSLFQLEELVKQFEDDQEECPPEDRLEYFFQLTFPPIYILRKELADRYFEFGGLRTAQSLYEKLELWPEVVRCLHCQDKPKRATALVEKRLEADPQNPEMWDLYGTVANNPEHYEKAWQVSGRSFAKAKRNLGNHYMKSQEWQKALNAYDVSLQLNYMYPRTWFACGCAAIKCQNWQKAMESFSTAVQLDPEDAESWTNLSSIYIQTNQKDKALKTLREALRLKPDNYQMWENHMILCLQTQDYQQVVSSVIQLITLKSRKEVDIKVLGHLVSVLDKLHRDPEHCKEFEALHRRMEVMWDKITNNMSQNPDVWNIYAIYLSILGRFEDMIKARQAEVRSAKVYNWNNDREKLRRVCEASLECTNAQMDIEMMRKKIPDEITLKMYLHGAMSMLQGIAHDETASILFAKEEFMQNVRKRFEEAQRLYESEFPGE
mmetsp:Transcript_7496/g.28121  ORF Transcript_7496/g.28121 Transcript_7496/m.28121 type:complete len:938 (-) Transcript_7496:8-2821(-)